MTEQSRAHGWVSQVWGTESGNSRAEHQHGTGHAVAQPGRLRPVVEYVAEMTAAAVAVDLGPQHHQPAIRCRVHGADQRMPEARPSGAAVELSNRRKQRVGAAGAVIAAGLHLLVER